jgi:hypothetical protein
MLIFITQAYPIDTVKTAYQRDCLHMPDAGKKSLVRRAVKYGSMKSFFGNTPAFFLS